MDITATMLRHAPRLLHWLGRLTGANREAEMALLDILCDSDRASVDVGAKTGMYSTRMLAHSATVIAFEPNPDHAHLLRKVFGGRVEVHEVALSDKEGPAVLRLPTGKPGRATIEETNRLEGVGGSMQSIPVSTGRLDDMGQADIGFIKIDVEGHEMAVLAGATQTIARCRPNMLIEANNAHSPGAVNRLAEWAGATDLRVFFMAGARLVSMPERRAAQGTKRAEPVWHVERANGSEIENFILLPVESVSLAETIRARLAGN